MAKQNKGLGRGLNSLLGGVAEEAPPIEKPKPEDKSRVTVDAEDPSSRGTFEDLAAKELAGERAVEDAPAKTPTVKASPQKATSSIKEKAAGAEKAADQKASREENYKIAGQMHGDDNVVIKEVVERAPSEVPLSSVKPNPDQPRTNFNSEELDELATSIEKDGLLQPILVRQMGSDYQIIAGERRWQACRSLGLSSIPVRIKEANDDKALELALVENIQRSDLNPIEEAYGYRRLMDRQGLTQSEVAQVVSKGRSTVANALRLLELPEAAQQMLFEDKISAGHARAILSIPSKEGKEKLTNKLVEEKLSVRESEALARLYIGSQNNEGGSTRTPAPLAFKRIARALRDSLETNVKVKTVKGKNKIEIEFSDEDELEQLFEKLTAFQD